MASSPVSTSTLSCSRSINKTIVVFELCKDRLYIEVPLFPELNAPFKIEFFILIKFEFNIVNQSFNTLDSSLVLLASRYLCFFFLYCTLQNTQNINHLLALFFSSSFPNSFFSTLMFLLPNLYVNDNLNSLTS